MQNKMKKLLHWFNGIKLRYKLAIFYSLFCFLPVMLLFLAELSADAKYY